jgi:hypothetical protein
MQAGLSRRRVLFHTGRSSAGPAKEGREQVLMRTVACACTLLLSLYLNLSTAPDNVKAATSTLKVKVAGRAAHLVRQHAHRTFIPCPLSCWMAQCIVNARFPCQESGKQSKFLLQCDFFCQGSRERMSPTMLEPSASTASVA